MRPILKAVYVRKRGQYWRRPIFALPKLGKFGGVLKNLDDFFFYIYAAYTIKSIRTAALQILLHQYLNHQEFSIPSYE